MCLQTLLQLTNVFEMSTAKSVCYGCDSLIEDRYLLRVMEQTWHERCMYCSVCMQPLRQSCFIKDKQLYCKLDYDRLFGIRCSRCLQLIPSHDYVMRAVNQVYHVNCFACVVCGRQLNKGDQFLVTDCGHIYCSVHFDVHSQCSSYVQLSPESQLNGDWFTNAGSDDDSSLDDDGDQPKGPKRPRTILTTSQRRKFKASFEVNSKPCRKMKKLARRQTEDCQQMNNANKDKRSIIPAKNSKKVTDNDLNSPALPNVDSNQSDSSTTQCTDHRRLNDDHKQLVSSAYTTAFTEHNRNGVLYNEVFPENQHGGIDMSTHTIESLQMLINGNTPAPSVAGNPIDKLYSMQSSYFSNST